MKPAGKPCPTCKGTGSVAKRCNARIKSQIRYYGSGEVARRPGQRCQNSTGGGEYCHWHRGGC